MNSVAVTLFGGFEVRLAGELCVLPGQKDRALLALLAVAAGTAQSRERLAGMLWGDHGDVQARDSLKHALARLRVALDGEGMPALEADRHAVRLDPRAVAVDVVEFQERLAVGTPEALEAALALYRGDLLEGISVRDAAFEDWLRVERARLRSRAEAAAAGLMARALEEGATAKAEAAARRLLALDPLREDACRTLMQLHRDRHETAQALKLYATLRDLLHRDLGVAPEVPTVLLFDEIRDGRLAAASAAPAQAAQTPGPPLPDRPSIAVLAFKNLSGDPAQDYFADGVVEEIIGALSHLRWLFVIARSSSFTYRDRAADVTQVGRELGVRYVVEGSVRKSADRVRIMTHLIDAISGAHLSADRFEGRMADLFDLQDQVTASVVGAIAPKLERAEIERARLKPTASLDAYDCYLRGLSSVHAWKAEATHEALRMFAQAVEIDRRFAAAYGFAARCYSQSKACGWRRDPARDVAEVRRLASLAVEFGPDDAVALSTAGIARHFVAGDTDDGAALIERALELNPNLAMAWLFSGWVAAWDGDPTRAIDHIERAIRFSPADPQFAMMQGAMACAHFFAGRDDEAVAWAERSLRLQPSYRIASCVLAASRAVTGQVAQAREDVARLRRLDPDLRVSNLLDSFPIRRKDHFERWAEGLRAAGLPE